MCSGFRPKSGKERQFSLKKTVSHNGLFHKIMGDNPVTTLHLVVFEPDRQEKDSAKSRGSAPVV